MKKINLAVLCCAVLASSVAGSSFAMSKFSLPNHSFLSTQSCPTVRLSSNGNQGRSYLKNIEWKTCNNYRLVFQNDGNLVLYKPSNLGKPSNSVVWATGTVNQGNRFAIEADGNIVLYNRNNESIWATNTAGNRGASLVVQTDGNLVVYKPGPNDPKNVLWSSGTYGGRTGTRNASNEWLATWPVPAPLPPSNKPSKPMAKMLAKSNCLFGSVGTCNGDGEHTGVDYEAPVGIEVRAICDGIVEEALSESMSNGKNVRNRFTIIKHSDCGGYKQLYSYYGHINPLVTKGAGKNPTYVKKGDKIGAIAAYPPNNEHLHFGLSTGYLSNNWGYRSELKTLGWIDPLGFAKKSGW
jgi:murein DD-endopeptidase MepM/ murein hydrolase activator NlpD